MAWLGRISRDRRRHRAIPLSELGSSAQVVQLAHATLGRLPASRTTGAAAQQAVGQLVTVYRSLGVSLVPAGGGLARLDAYVLAPLRDAAFLSVLRLDREIDQHLRMGMDLPGAVRLVSATWVSDFGALLLDAERRRREPDGVPLSRDDTVSTGGFHQMHGHPPHLVVRERAMEAVRRAEQHDATDAFAERERAQRIKRRMDDFEVHGVSLTGGAAAREVRRVIFVTALIVTDDIHYKTLKSPPDAAAAIYRETIVRFLAAAARLVGGDYQ